MFHYEDVGKSIKNLARTIAIITLVVYLLIALTMFFSSFPQSRYDDVNVGTMIGSFAVAALGFVAAWLSGLLLFGFGELIDNSTDIRAHLLASEQEIPEKVYEKIPTWKRVEAEKDAQ